MSQLLLEASLADVDDCTKEFVCLLHAKPIASLDAMELSIYSLFDDSVGIDVERTDVEFQLAAFIGKGVGVSQCQTVYARCSSSYEETKAPMEIDRGRRFGRSVEVEGVKVQDLLLKASVNDVDDCAKNFVCQLNTKSIESMDSVEQTLLAIYGQDASIDVSRSDVEFQLAANVGRLAGAEQCQTVYARCPMEYDQLLQTFEGKFTSSETLNQL
ncbi:hypothetical protein TCAL_15114 [Tigriopus californicus]|uniref:Uncharacterized protein n=1 Tax=Tigriopus californicus TaxID=6832 RepID=A0A553NU53_TIGCA|nr:hypothetical protein TCAL_15114 [Tigriopus californicus]